ncbi:MAG: major facilitator superfamily 1 [Rhodospirillales bacterium]|jgi:MFS family permease|nr:major facilitator superfamily 1 [Rhodospirillales bacterium]
MLDAGPSDDRGEEIAAVVETRPSTGLALAGLSLAMLLSTLGISIANVGLPTLERAFGASFQDIQWVVLAYLLSITTLSVSAGRLGDEYGRRRLLLVGLAIFTAASVVCGLAPTLGLLIAARAAQGVGAAIMMALAIAMVGEIVAKEKTGSAMGLLGTMSAAGTALGPSLGGFLISAFGWPSLFFVTVPLGIAALILVHRSLPVARAARTADPRPNDATGTLLLGTTLAAYALAMTLGRGDFGALNIALLAAAGIGTGLFVLVESKAAAPLIQLTTLRDPKLSAGFIMSALISAVMMVTLVVGPFYLSRALGLAPEFVGLFLSVGPLVVVLTGIPAGRVVDRLGARGITLAGLVAAALGCLGLSVMPLSFGIVGYVAPLVVLTAGYALFQTANNTAVMAGIAADRRGVVSGVLNLSRNLGLITGASVMGALFAVASAADGIASSEAEAVAFGMRCTFGAAAVLVVAALGVAWRGHEVRS